MLRSSLVISIAAVGYTAFIGKSANGNDGCAYRATLRGPPIINSGNNEGVWLLTSSPSRWLAVPMGQSTRLPACIKIARIVKFWAMGASTASNEQCLALMQLSGTGRGRALVYNAYIGFTIEFKNGVHQIVTGNID